MLALDLQVVISDLHAQLIGGEVLDVQVDCKLVLVRPHLKKHTDREVQSELWKDLVCLTTPQQKIHFTPANIKRNMKSLRNVNLFSTVTVLTVFTSEIPELEESRRLRKSECL